MKVLILGAGYGTRLQRDLSGSADHQHLLGIPKALLPLGGRDALITHWLELFDKQDVFVVCNAVSYDAFKAWSERNGIAADHVVSDGTTSNEDRLGAVPDMSFAIHHFGFQDEPVLVVGGDTLFLNDFKLPAFLQRASGQDAAVTTYTVEDAEVHKFGILEVDSEGYITQFLEKPSPDATSSRLACPCFYWFAASTVPYIHEFVEAHKNAAKEEYDATGKLLAYLYPRVKIATHPVAGRIDVGGLASYLDADAYFKN
ncbi:nucleotide-diphospho-sugar transferase [Syncephalastrum racemosum]|uniref:Nucleotide-diphospho-sugar transferase n=1 Tax=Syncephalastrum racemosum TaxID=13706 RepID=A0A1X2H9Z3_SYNRA|nr:nucleotide-diphospho-sugar transferase [Syncephalastrum racemosum]